MASNSFDDSDSTKSMDINGEICSSEDYSDLKDDIYYALKKSLLVSGRGRPPNLPALTINRRLILQLCVIREETGSTYTDLHCWFNRISPFIKVECDKLKNDAQRLWARYLKSRGSVLPEFFHQMYDPNFISSELEDIGINRLVLMAPPKDFNLPQTAPPVLNKTIISLECFRAQQKLPQSFLIGWVVKIVNGEEFAVKKQVNSLLKDYNDARKRKDRNPSRYFSLLEELFILRIAKLDVVDVSINSEALCSPEVIIRPTANAGSQAVRQMKSKYSQTVETEEGKKFHKLKLEVSALRDEVENTQSTKLYAKNYTLKKDREEMSSHIDNLEASLSKLKEELASSKKDKVCLQKALSKLRKDKERLKEEVKEKEEKISFLQGIMATESGRIDTREERNRFSDDVRHTIMSLEGAGVAASKCPEVMDIVSKCLFHQNLDLPHWTTCNKIVEEANAICKIQIAEKLYNSNYATLHTDGTSRDKRKYVGQQVTLDDGTNMSLGFVEVASEDAQTVLETTVEVLRDLSSIYEEGERDMVFRKMVAVISSTMSDRASVMKCFGDKLHDYRVGILGEARTLFLHCNAHFLLGVSNSCEQALIALEKSVVAERGCGLGRDKHPLFRFWRGDDCASFRLLRTTSDCLGPRGDEKSGVRHEWLGYCRNENIKSNLTSHRSNRFNNIFHNAQAIFELQPHIIRFLTRFCSTASQNKKLKSILLDAEDLQLQINLCSLALLFHHLTTPYWALVNSRTAYTDLHHFVKKMIVNLRTWEEFPEKVLQDECGGAFDGLFHKQIKPQLLTYAKGNRSAVERVVKECCGAVLKVAERQLADFLDGGVYGGEIGDDVKDELKNCPLTNLTGEHAFGDLDYDLNSRRNCSLFNRSTKHMLKRNKTMEWLSEKGEDERRRIMKDGRRMGKVFRRKFQAQEGMVKLKIRESIIENERKKYEKEAKLAKEKEDVLDRVLKDGGVCKSEEDVNKLSTVDSIKAQLKYHKIFLEKKDVYVGGNKDILRERLLGIVKNDPLNSLENSPPQKRIRLDSSPPAANESDGEAEEEDVLFHFEEQGMWVAVYYDQQFYIGQVIDIVTPTSSYIKFLSEVKCHAGTFKWPTSEDIAEVDSSFVFRWDFDVLPANNGRAWTVPAITEIGNAYRRLRDM